jgi:diaminopimelate epimerase
VHARGLQKWHGAGNDFLVELADDGESRWDPASARRVLNRHLGVGADGLLIGSAVSETDVTMILYNADGSTAEMSGNGARCLAAAVLRDAGRDKGVLCLLTAAGRRTVSLELKDTVGHGEVDMGEVRLSAPPEGALGVANVGNPHVVVADRPEWDDRVREDIAASFAQPLGGANVGFATVTGADSVDLRVVERGVGWTLACGTGSVAAAAILHHLGQVGPVVEMRNPGGTLSVRLTGDLASLAGPVRHVADITWDQP